MEKITITVDITKIDKNRITERTYQDKSGKVVSVKEYKMDIVPLTNTKVISEGGTWKMVKSHFVCEAQTKEERENKKETVYLGEGIVFEKKEAEGISNADYEAHESINPEDIPF